MKTTRFLLLTTVFAASLLGLVFVLTGPGAGWLARHWLQQLDDADEEQAVVLLDKMAVLGDLGIPQLALAMDSSRPSVAAAARQRLLDRLELWESLPVGQASSRLAMLADVLAENVDDFGPAARRNAADLAASILRRPLDPNAVDRAGMISACERVLRAVESDIPPAETPAMLADTTDKTNVLREAVRRGISDDALFLGPSIPELADLPGGNLGPDVSPRQDSTPTLSAADETSPRLLKKPPSPDQPEAIERTPVGEQPQLFGNANGITKPLYAANDADPPQTARRPGESLRNPFAPMSLETPVAPATDSRSAETIELVRRLRSADDQAAAQARTELTRRGFTEVHFELARQLLDPNPDVRKRLAQALPRLRSVEAEPWLLWLAEDPDADVRAAVIALLATGNDPGLLEKVERIARADAAAQVRRLADPIARRRAEMRF